nr:(5-formylfuran-3-yl)methyl phosphate synthase [Methylophaga muralis]
MWFGRCLRIENIQQLRPLDADYLGFRSAICHQHTRTNLLDPNLAKQIQFQMNASMPKAKTG